ncbi:DUF4153 domain-containing protein [Pseudomonas chlororaphis]|uniref:DUF4153 domain-containing protein n=1 Tax=Pseudomonas chlororaphis TaxID=587753 RepID=A0A0D5XRT1_9PSED|nr:DUF4153 domain-containing protein [Pseudomonas chlororaphis]AKA21791.1 hypothetical protein PCL1606_03360 [Pseudomonas chlororaphis]
MPVLNPSLLFYIAIALVQGLLLVSGLVYRQPALASASLMLALVAGVNLQLLGNALLERGTWLLVIGFSVLMSGLSGWVFNHDPYGWLWRFWLFAAAVLVYIGTAFVLSWPTREGNRPRYQDLFRHAWNNAFIVLLALLVTLAFSLLLWLCGQLFSILGMPQPGELFASPYFICFSLPMFFSLGMRMGRENERVIGLLRGILLTVCRYLLPLSALITLVFTLALALTGLQPIWNTGYSSSILLCLAGCNLFLLNGVFQDGQHDAGYARPLKVLVNASLCCLPLLVLLAGYSSWLRIDQYGLTPARFLAMLFVVLALVHSLAALWAVLGKQSVWLASLRRSNPWMALLSFVVLLLVFSPVLDPQAFSASNQVQRLLDGRTPVSEFDARTLRQRLGVPGREQFDALLERVRQGQILDEPGRAQLLGLLEGVSPKDQPADYLKPHLYWLGPVPDGSQQLIDVLTTLSECTPPGCTAWAVDLDDDGIDEVLLIDKQSWASSALLFARRDQGKGSWRHEGTLSGIEDAPGLIAQIREGKIKPVRPRYKTLRIDGVELNTQWFHPRD